MLKADPSATQVVSVARALELVELVVHGPDEGLSLAEIARTTNRSKSAILATLRTLVDFGYVRSIEPGPKYLPGMTLIRFGDLTAVKDPLGAIARPILTELSGESGLTIRVARNVGGFPVFIERVDGPGVVRFHTPLGARELPHVSSAGKAILAELSDSEIREVARECGLVSRTKKSITTVSELMAEIEKVRHDGFAIDDEEDVQGIYCIGAAIFDHFGKCIGAISATGVRRDLTPAQVNRLGKLVMKYADQVTDQLHGRKSVRGGK
ncbi:MAG: IclR family transcriptional regulator [Actinobacteria bacterium]|nr:IclR family transcriptional regulator [Actinomycetota bacterium]